MPVKILNAVETEINAFLETPGIRVQTRHVLPADTTGGWPNKIAIFYETAADDAAAKDRALIEQNDQMDRLIDIAREVSQDKNYGVFKNNTQKEIYLLTRHNLPKSDAAAVIELLKPEMASVLGA